MHLESGGARGLLRPFTSGDNVELMAFLSHDAPCTVSPDERCFVVFICCPRTSLPL